MSDPLNESQKVAALEGEMAVANAALKAHEARLNVVEQDVNAIFDLVEGLDGFLGRKQKAATS